jgi:PAS domain S-box-containing protein
MAARSVTSTSVSCGPVADNRYRELLEAAPDGIVEVDRTGRIVLVNSQAERMFGYRRQELLGKSVEMLMPESFRGRHPAHRDRYSEHSVPRPMGSGHDLRAVRADGTEFAVDINLSPFEGEPGGSVVCAIGDVSDRKLAEEQTKSLNLSLEQRTRDLAVINSELEIRNREVEKANRLKSNFLATTSHDLLIDDTLDLSKIEAGRLDLNVESFSLSTASDEVLSALRPMAAAKEPDLNTGLGPDLISHADRVRVRQILYNLLGNATKVTPATGRVRLVAESNTSR